MSEVEAMAAEEAASKPKKKKGGGDDEGGDTFIVSFTALMIILLAFFVFLNTLAVQDNKRERKALASLMGTFGFLPDGQGSEDEGGPIGRSLLIDESSQLQDALTSLRNLVKVTELDKDIHFRQGQNRYAITFSDSILFDGGGEVINPVVFPILDRLGGAIRELGIKVRIEGHTDPLPPSDDYDAQDNWGMGAFRAISVADYFERACRAPRRLLEVASRAHYVPIADNSTRAGRRTNRRVEVVLMRSEESVHHGSGGFTGPVRPGGAHGR